ncbi:hypothetical protein E2C01_093830 [Portunus trituberculatus]|uniref:Uncharacterized protein n=1 Tax=Portunus trituberculatus TaxID=210409 RepID=A0A5B7JZS9_PORTR|nr:hypothetical protein [Portunus trituberculatus]
MYLEGPGAEVPWVAGLYCGGAEAGPSFRPPPTLPPPRQTRPNRVAGTPSSGTHLGLILVLSSTHEISTFTSSYIYIFKLPDANI